MENNVKRQLPDDLMNELNLKPYETTDIGHPEEQRVAPKVRVTTGQDKVVDSLEQVIKDNLKDGMTISFHHHFRNGDFAFNKVMDLIIKLGYKDLTLAPSSLTGVMNDKIIEAIKKGLSLILLLLGCVVHSATLFHMVA